MNRNTTIIVYDSTIRYIIVYYSISWHCDIGDIGASRASSPCHAGKGATCEAICSQPKLDLHGCVCEREQDSRHKIGSFHQEYQTLLRVFNQSKNDSLVSLVTRRAVNVDFLGAQSVGLRCKSVWEDGLQDSSSGLPNLPTTTALGRDERSQDSQHLLEFTTTFIASQA